MLTISCCKACLHQCTSPFIFTPFMSGFLGRYFVSVTSVTSSKTCKTHQSQDFVENGVAKMGRRFLYVARKRVLGSLLPIWLPILYTPRWLQLPPCTPCWLAKGTCRAMLLEEQRRHTPRGLCPDPCGCALQRCRCGHAPSAGALLGSPPPPVPRPSPSTAATAPRSSQD